MWFYKQDSKAVQVLQVLVVLTIISTVYMILYAMVDKYRFYNYPPPPIVQTVASPPPPPDYRCPVGSTVEVTRKGNIITVSNVCIDATTEGE